MVPRRDKDTGPHGAPLDPELEADLGAEYELRGDHLAGELEAVRAEAAANLELAQRVQAEFENYRRRVGRETEDLRRRAGESIVIALLPILDNLERAIDHTLAGGDTQHLLAGVEMVYGQVKDVFGKEGVEVIDPFGQPFDPNMHQAVGQQEDPEVPEGTVVDVYQKGYAMHGRVVREAMVVVSTGGPSREE